jgi:hypothetical protein
MAVTPAFLLIVALLVLIVLGAVLGLVLLLANPATRSIGLALLALPAVALVLGFLAVFSFQGHREQAHAQRARDAVNEARAAAKEARDAALDESVAVALQPERARPGAGTVAEFLAEEEARAEEPLAEEPSAGEEPADDDRPDWVDAAPHRAGGVYRMPIMVGPYTTRLECDAKLPDELRNAIDAYVTDYIGPEASGRVRLPSDYVREHVARETWQQTKRFSVGPMVQLHVLLEFDREVNARLDEQWHRAMVAERLGGAGTLAVAGFLLLSAVWGYLRVDLATGGAYRGRLRLAAGAAMLAVISAVVWLVAA